MEWFFVKTDIISEKYTGFSIRLNSGGWDKPYDIDPDSTGLTTQEQAQLLREGLKQARLLINELNDFRANYN